MKINKKIKIKKGFTIKGKYKKIYIKIQILDLEM